MPISTPLRGALHAVTDTQGLLVLVKIDDAALSAPVRLVADTRDLVAMGDTWLAIPLRVTHAADVAGEVPRTQIQMDNVGRELTGELERLPPGARLKATLIYVYRATPTVVEYEFTHDLTSIKASMGSISATIGPGTQMRAPAVRVRFDLQNAPAVFGP